MLDLSEIRAFVVAEGLPEADLEAVGVEPLETRLTLLELEGEEELALEREARGRVPTDGREVAEERAEEVLAAVWMGSKARQGR